MSKPSEKPGFFDRIIERLSRTIKYCTEDVWSDQRDNIWIRIVKTVNLTVQAFTNRDLQIKSMAITYQTVFAMVPALALLLAISRGFGFQEIVQNELYTYFPSQSKALSAALGFVDSYLAEASSGILVGVGILVLLWTLISLLSNIEDSFNSIWDLHNGRNLIQKVKDYIAIFLLIPILMILSSGISIFMSTTIQSNLPYQFLSPMVNVFLEILPLVLCWAAFTLCFWLIPNTRVQFKYAAISGIICSIAFDILQLLFLNGQIYVSKYNAIYGSIAFLPLLLIWLQLSWLLLLSGCGLTYAMQNIFSYNFFGSMSSISLAYYRKVLLVVTAVIYRRFHKGLPAPTRNSLSLEYGLPIRMVSSITEWLQKSGLIQKNDNAGGKEDPGLLPITDTDKITIKDVLEMTDGTGKKGFIPKFSTTYREVLDEIDIIFQNMYEAAGDKPVRDLEINIEIPKETDQYDTTEKEEERPSE
ncbi:MAG: YihY/virulence factor BrkB family protein [Muribaculaceae bacterium]|nr:YihY/virulence factor BrkB family protein [Muribaculaceae bacterium]